MKVALVLLLGMTVAACAQVQHDPHALYYRIGPATDVVRRPTPGYALMGGGTDLDEAFRWLCDRADDGDLLVLRASGDDAYNPYIKGLCKLNSVATVIIPDHEAALEPLVAAKIQTASAIFISGGDQSKYTGFWRGTPVESALRDAVKRGIPIGGTSAGLAVLGEYIYSAENDRLDDPDLKSEYALADPFYRQVVIVPDLLGIPILRGIITDTHFDTRHREGRLLVFMSRILVSGQTSRIRGIGVDEKTALLVGPDGEARVVGKGEVDFFEASHKPTACKSGLSLTFAPISKESVKTGKSFNLATWQGESVHATLSVDKGKVSLGPMS